MIYIVRHGQTDWNLKRIYQGRIDIELNSKGIEQANALQEKLKDVKFDYVFCSPLKRALQTAQIITNHHISIDERLIERCNGEFEGKKIEDCPTDYDFNDPADSRYGIENITEFKNRIAGFLQDVCAKHKNKDVLIVTHAGVILYLREFFEGKPKDNNFENYKIQNGQVLVYDNK